MGGDRNQISHGLGQNIEKIDDKISLIFLCWVNFLAKQSEVSVCAWGRITRPNFYRYFLVKKHQFFF